jgi:hypothetical protein
MIIDAKDLTLEKAAAGCIVRNMHESDYHDFDAISSSGLGYIKKSPAHFKCRHLKKRSPEFALGSAAHAAILEPDVFKRDYVVVDAEDRRTASYKAAKKEHGEEKLLLKKDADLIEGMSDAAWLDDRINDFLSMEGESELSFFATEPETGLLIKARFDFLSMSEKVCIDLKTTADIFSFKKSIENYGYYRQQAFYSDIFFWVTGDFLERFLFLAVEKEPPFSAKLFEIDEEYFIAAREEVRELLYVYAECKKKDRWPKLSSEIEKVEMPRWARKERPKWVRSQ